MNDAQAHTAAALEALRNAVTRLEDAAGCIKAQGLNDFDARSLAIARTHVETAEMWLERARA